MAVMAVMAQPTLGPTGKFHQPLILWAWVQAAKRRIWRRAFRAPQASAEPRVSTVKMGWVELGSGSSPTMVDM
jgi:hypothetical protein